jgi:hypothetical protein
MNVLDAWLTTVATDLGLDPASLNRDAVLDLTRDVAHGVARPAAPLTAYLVGLAAGRAGGAPDDVSRAVATAMRSVRRWADEHPQTDDDPTSKGAR